MSALLLNALMTLNCTFVIEASHMMIAALAFFISLFIIGHQASQERSFLKIQKASMSMTHNTPVKKPVIELNDYKRVVTHAVFSLILKDDNYYSSLVREFEDVNFTTVQDVYSNRVRYC